MRPKSHPFPTARQTGATIPLALRVGDEVISGGSVRDFLHNVLTHIDQKGLLKRLPLPFATSGVNNLVARSARHPDQRPFAVTLLYRPVVGNPLYININHPRFFALRQGARLLEAVGLKAVPTEQFTGKQ
jgi:hypothetical protein